MNFDEIRLKFENEFQMVKDQFEVFQLTVEEAYQSKDLRVTQPGIYVWIKGVDVFKVGRSLTNSRKRSLEHIRDNTGNEMVHLKDDPEASLVLFNLKIENENLHWVVALEVFFEKTLNPKIRSNRIG